MTYLLAQASAHRIPLRDESVQCVVTSPPYWGLRVYSGEQHFVWGGDSKHAHEWGMRTRIPQHSDDGVTGSTLQGSKSTQAQSQRTPVVDGDCACGAWYGALGLEPTPQLYVEHMVEVFREVGRVMRKDGTLWLNLGDSYAAQNSGSNGYRDGRSNRTERRAAGVPASLKPKDLVGIPWRVALALQEDGWTLRSEIIWNKPNPMPESVTDRPTKSHETVFLFSKRERYYFDGDAIAEPVAPSSIARVAQNNGNPTFDGARARREAGHIAGRDTMRPDQLVPESGMRNVRTVWTIATQPYPGAHFATFPEGLPERCIKAGSCAGSVVLDPFNGSGTTGRVAMRLGRRYVGLDLSREYLTEQAIARIDPITHTHRTTDQMALPL